MVKVVSVGKFGGIVARYVFVRPYSTIRAYKGAHISYGRSIMYKFALHTTYLPPKLPTESNAKPEDLTTVE